MNGKSVEDYLTEGMYGKRRPKEAERLQYLGTLRERIVLALTIGQVMTDSGIDALEDAMKSHPKTKLLINGQVSYRFLDCEKQLAQKYNIPYTIISDEDVETEIGAILTYDHAVNIDDIYIEEKDTNNNSKGKEKCSNETSSIIKKMKNWFKN